MKKSIVLITIIMSVFSFLAITANAAEPTSAEPITIHSSNSTALTFTLRTPSLAFENGVPVAPGLDARISEAGSPDLPYYSTFIALPPNGSAEITVQARDLSQQAVDSMPSVGIADVPDIDRLSMEIQGVEEFGLRYEPNTAIYNASQPFPTTLYRLSEPMIARDSRLVRLDLFPVRYNPSENSITLASELEVSIQFSGENWQNMRTVDKAASPIAPMALSALNTDQATMWRSLPQAKVATPNTVTVPTDRESFKIEVDAEGIYEISYADLQAAGMAVDSINPLVFEMMSNGQPVSYQFIGDGDTAFEAGEAIRFFGFAYEGTREEEAFVKNNVFWLWTDGTPQLVQDLVPDVAATPVDHFISTVSVEPNTYFFSTWSNSWDTFPNEPTAWYWARLTANDMTFDVEMPDLFPAGSEAYVEVELMSGGGKTPTTTMNVYANAGVTPISADWKGKVSFNVTGTIPLSDIASGTNSFKMNFSEHRNYVYLNHIEVQYPRQFVANNDQLIWEYLPTGSHQFNIAGFTNNDAAEAIVWEISNPTQPSRHPLTAADISGAIGDYAYEVNAAHGDDARFIALTSAELMSTTSLAKYLPTNLQPASTTISWLAISHSDFIMEAQRLAAYREVALHGSHQTFVADVEDVINQFGYGLPMPSSIHAYLQYAYDNWDTAPQYVLLFGDGSSDPKNIKDTIPNFVPTYLPFIDRFQGMVPSDLPFALLAGNDLLPDVAVGRISANTSAEATAAVDKIILFENSVLSEAPWTKEIVFVSDNLDSGGDFCGASLASSTHLPGDYTSQQFCMTDNSAATVTAVRTDLFNQLSITGTLIVNYRGHGAIDHWSAEGLMSVTDIPSWNNPTRPAVIVSADCLDGHFSFPNLRSLSEKYLTAENMGTAAHWSSTGLGYSFEHSVLHNGFYDGIFIQNLFTMGDATVYAKGLYAISGYDDSEMYAFTMQGDPAMFLRIPGVPTAVSMTTGATTAPTITTGQWLLPLALLTSMTLFAYRNNSRKMSLVEVEK